MSQPETNATVPDVYRAISAATKALSHDGISKDKKNEQQGYKFRGIDDIYNALSAVISGADLCILPRMAERTQTERTTQKGGVLFYVTVRAEFDFVSARDGSKHTVTMYGEAMDSADKATNKAMSAAYKYACLQVFCIPTEGMDDADSHTPEPAPRPEPAKPKAVPAPTPAPINGGSKILTISAFRAAKKAEQIKAFATIKPVIGKRYYEILGVHGCEHANQFSTLGEAVQAYSEMVAEYEDQVRSRAI